MAKHKIIQSNKNRWGIYVGLGIIFAAVIVATLVEVGWLTDEQIDSWVTRVGLLVVAFFGLAQSVLAAVNTDTTEPVDPPAPAEQLGR